MATVRKWSGVSIAMQSALAAADTITGITKASPAVVTATAHGMANGDYVYLEIQGMHQLNGRVCRIANVAANTFELEGVDSSSFDTFASGTAKAITFGTTITTATSMSASGGDFDFIDTTTIHDNVKKQVPGVGNPLTYTFDNIWDAADAGQIALKAASDAQAVRAFKMQFGTGGPIVAFAGYVGFTGAPTGSAQDKVVTPCAITAFGAISQYAS
ncbi:MAG: phage tail tube protein [Aeromonas veronii]